MKFHKKPRLKDNDGRQLSSHDLERKVQRASDWIDKLPRAWFLALITGIFFGLFMFFKWWNRGGVNLINSGDNIVNMAILLVLFGLLDTLWDFNGEEGMGWGQM